MPDLAELERRLSAATGADRGLDGLIARDVEGWLPAFDLEGDDLLKWPDLGGHWHLPHDPCDGVHSVSQVRNPDPPCYTASIDSALALVEEKLPGVFFLVGKGKCSASEPLFGAQLLFGDEVIGEGESNSPALSICLALIRALREMEGSDG